MWIFWVANKNEGQTLVIRPVILLCLAFGDARSRWDMMGYDRLCSGNFYGQCIWYDFDNVVYHRLFGGEWRGRFGDSIWGVSMSFPYHMIVHEYSFEGRMSWQMSHPELVAGKFIV